MTHDAPKIEDGGAVFYHAPQIVGSKRMRLTLRDYFAGQALCWAQRDFGRLPATSGKLAEDCYAIADAMLAARKAGGAS